MKSEEKTRKRLNRLLVDYFLDKFSYQDKRLAEERIRELVWVLDECILVEGGTAKLCETRK